MVVMQVVFQRWLRCTATVVAEAAPLVKVNKRGTKGVKKLPTNTTTTKLQRRPIFLRFLRF